MNKDLLHQKWIRSYEEDLEDKMVYRLDAYKFPLRRGGREAIDLRTDKSFIQRETAPDDRYHFKEGAWLIEGEDVLSFEGEEPGAQKLEILSLTIDKLILKKL